MAEYDELKKIHDEDNQQASRDRIIRLETSLTDFITHTDKTINELKIFSIETQKLMVTINNRLDLLENKFENHVQTQLTNEKRSKWTFSILIPAIVASFIELVNLLVAYGKI